MRLLLLLVLASLLVGCSHVADSDLSQKSEYTDNVRQVLRQEETPTTDLQSAVAQVASAQIAAKNNVGVACTLTRGGDAIDYFALGEDMRMDGFMSPLNPDSFRSETSLIKNGTGVFVWEGNQGASLIFADTDETTIKQVLDSLPDLEIESDVNFFIDQGFSLDCYESEVSSEMFAQPAIAYQNLADALTEMNSKVDKANKAKEDLDKLIDEKNKSMGL